MALKIGETWLELFSGQLYFSQAFLQRRHCAKWPLHNCLPDYLKNILGEMQDKVMM